MCHDGPHNDPEASPWYKHAFNVRRDISIVSAKHYQVEDKIVYNVVYQLLSEVAQFCCLFIVYYDMSAFNWPPFVIV